MNAFSETKLGYGLMSVTSPFDGHLVDTVSETTADEIDELMGRARFGQQVARELSRSKRAEILEQAARIIEDESEHFARQIVEEAGKTIRQARKEVARCINTLKLSADEARHSSGKIIPFDSYPGSEKRQGWFTREPLGIIVAITPFNDPLNLVAHKLGPAIAGGNAVLLKPSELTPLSALSLVEVLVSAGLPDTVITPVVGGVELGHALVSQRDVRMISFTGGFQTGEAISSSAGLKKLAMDLGGNAPVIVMADSDMDKAVEACISGAFWAAGQNCIGTQRILIDHSIFSDFRDRFVAATEGLVLGDPSSEETDVGPMITEASAKRTETRVSEAVNQGARVLAGHRRQAALYAPTVLIDVPHDSSLWREEAFAPVVILEKFDTFDEAIALANAIDFSLHSGIFTGSLETALDAVSQIEAGGVMVNDSSDYRFDAMPFGGFKYGSLGREGVHFAFEDMTQTKVVCINRF
ncbi:aldehyde dehydrogenase family protein [Halomonas nitroreducens]|uniref:Aldehyde dehydrogenase family protein n=1 Tax=Halomonas nitroreducens TaxID=447425 RepID=A0A3S0HT47_9GAMM|nr:aldehyde dehydrogenase family protein [Halomonas nitroreducens]RTR02983.1 aldehyde dehydrogenase family protein [Halomonas nitroreducens]